MFQWVEAPCLSRKANQHGGVAVGLRDFNSLATFWADDLQRHEVLLQPDRLHFFISQEVCPLLLDYEVAEKKAMVLEAYVSRSHPLN
jgi:hypothetical protein